MGHATHQPAPPLTGRYAVVRTRTGETYVGEVVITDRLVTIDGSLRHLEMIGGASVFTYRRRRRRTISVAAIEAIVSDDE